LEVQLTVEKERKTLKEDHPPHRMRAISRVSGSTGSSIILDEKTKE
jgi:hypothetical protein